MADFDFNVSDYKPTEYELIEAGEYDAVIVESEKKPTKSGGSRLEMKVQIIGGKFANRTLYDNLNLWNRSEQATAIARGQLAAICAAVGVPTPRGSQELHNKRLRVVVGVEKREDNGELKNTIKGYKASQLSQQQQPQPAVSGGKPW